MKPRLLFLIIPIVAVTLSVAWKVSHRPTPSNNTPQFMQEGETARKDGEQLSDALVRHTSAWREDTRVGSSGSGVSCDTSMFFSRQKTDIRFEKPVSSESDLQPISQELLHLPEVDAWKARGDALDQHREIGIETTGDGSGNLCLRLTLKAYRGQVNDAILSW